MSLNTQDNISNSMVLQEQALIDKALINAGLPENKINSLIAMAKDKLSCDSDCQQKRLADNYKKKWDLAKQQYISAPEDIKQAEKNYYIYDKGYPAYKDMLYERYTKSAAEFKTQSNKKYTLVNEEISNLIDNYDTSTLYLRRMNDLLRVKLKENDDLKREIDQYIGFTQTSGRKVIYEDRARDWLYTARNILLFIYFSLLVLYIIFGKFIPKQEYLQWRVWLMLIIYILFPYFVLDKIVKGIFFLYNYIKSWSINKNVYTHL
uniref:Uncharacterized protein n=1 Tax=viral metagenome TaxID=1070528 RepID=A0A6C0IHM8_9ZZZZ